MIALAVLAVAAALPPASASAARPAVPTVSNVAPLNLGIGDTLTITGRNFRAGANRNTVVFKRDGQRAVFVRAEEATATRIRLKVPDKLSQYLSRRSDGTARPTRFRLRVLAARFGRTFTATRLSPVVSAAVSGSATPTTGTTIRNGSGRTETIAASTDPDCDGDGVPNSLDPDDDNDFLSDVLEISLKLNTCSNDTDGDGMQDGWEYQSAIDLNNPGCNNPAYPTPCTPATPYPWKVSYPNPLDGGDAGYDFDGDWIPAWQEHQAWMRHSGHDLSMAGMWYSDGLQASQDDPSITSCVGLAPPAPLLGNSSYSLDRDGDGCLNDNERDEDNDYLTNGEELSAQLSSIGWWSSVYDTENAFRYSFTGTNWLDGDTDGDGVVDGLDDQDHDDFWNVEEIERGSASVDSSGGSTGVTTGLWVNPFNPCLPWTGSRTCPIGVPASGTIWAPFPDRQGRLPQPRWPLWGTAAWPSGLPTHPISRPS